MQILEALQLKQLVRLALVGAGGKTSVMFSLARQITPPVIITTTTHLAREQALQADLLVELDTPEQVRLALDDLAAVTLMAGPSDDPARLAGLPPLALSELHARALEKGLSLLIEADGARLRPLKAPAAHEPAIPAWVETVVVVAGLSGLGKPLGPETVHRPELFARLSGLSLGDPVTAESLATELAHPAGGMKNIPESCRRVALLNQAGSPDLQASANRIAGRLLPAYERVIISAGMQLGPSEAPPGGPVMAVYTPVAGIILAGGQSKRLGRPKQLLLWRGEPFVRQVARSALQAGLSPVVVVTGAAQEGIVTALDGLAVQMVHNPEWELGQSTSIQAGLRALPGVSGAAIFLLSDQPQVPPMLISAVVEAHRTSLAQVIAPDVDGKRANPVLFDRSTFPDLMDLRGDTGGRAIFEKYRPARVAWYDPAILLDVDSPEDYQKLLDLESRQP